MTFLPFCVAVSNTKAKTAFGSNPPFRHGVVSLVSRKKKRENRFETLIIVGRFYISSPGMDAFETSREQLHYRIGESKQKM